MVFLDIRPLNIGHTLVIPKEHYVNIFDIPETLLSQVHTVTQKIASAIKKVTDADGISIISKTAKPQDKTYSTSTSTSCRVLKDKNYPLSANSKKSKEPS
jgi:diadenosine tetraphosphate (Ap4A) HIT family hydrolase